MQTVKHHSDILIYLDPQVIKDFEWTVTATGTAVTESTIPWYYFTRVSSLKTAFFPNKQGTVHSSASEVDYTKDFTEAEPVYGNSKHESIEWKRDWVCRPTANQHEGEAPTIVPHDVQLDYLAHSPYSHVYQCRHCNEQLRAGILFCTHCTTHVEYKPFTRPEQYMKSVVQRSGAFAPTEKEDVSMTSSVEEDHSVFRRI